MNAETSITLSPDRQFFASHQEHEVKFYITSFDHEYPDRPVQELEAACQKALLELGRSGGRARLEARAREILQA